LYAVEGIPCFPPLVPCNPERLGSWLGFVTKRLYAVEGIPCLPPRVPCNPKRWGSLFCGAFHLYSSAPLCIRTRTRALGPCVVLLRTPSRLRRELRFSHPNPASGSCLATAAADFPPHVGSWIQARIAGRPVFSGVLGGKTQTKTNWRIRRPQLEWRPWYHVDSSTLYARFARGAFSRTFL
jgi:hypothetical protein